MTPKKRHFLLSEFCLIYGLNIRANAPAQPYWSLILLILTSMPLFEMQFTTANSNDHKENKS